jgi:hypothetical protein
MLSGRCSLGAQVRPHPGSSRGPPWPRGSSEISAGLPPSNHLPQEPQKRRKGSGPLMENGRDGLVLPMSLAPNLRQKRNGITSTVWSPWKWVKNTRFTLDGWMPKRLMPRTARKPRSKTSVSAPVSTTTQLCRRRRRSEAVPVPTIVTLTSETFLFCSCATRGRCVGLQLAASEQRPTSTYLISCVV